MLIMQHLTRNAPTYVIDLYRDKYDMKKVTELAVYRKK